jgi:ribonucleoside-diphosphate reductase alpha chain
MTVEEWLGEDNQLGIDIWEKKYRYGNETLDEWVYRVSGGSPEVAQLILEKKFLFGGRILAHRGVPQNVQRTTYSNCYVLTVQDSLESIYNCCAEMARTYSLGGGVGVDISNLRPRGALVHNSAKETTGAVSFMKTFETVTSTIGQNGRRGALMLSINICHPDVEEFIDIKANTEEITHANISVRVSDAFMKAVENNEDFILHYPCEMTVSPQESRALSYNKLTCVETTGGPVYLKKVKAKDLFNKLVKNNWNYAEPGILYWDRITSWHMMSENPEFQYAGVNPCAEEPLDNQVVR